MWLGKILYLCGVGKIWLLFFFLPKTQQTVFFHHRLMPSFGWFLVFPQERPRVEEQGFYRSETETELNAESWPECSCSPCDSGQSCSLCFQNDHCTPIFLRSKYIFSGSVGWIIVCHFLTRQGKDSRDESLGDEQSSALIFLWIFQHIFGFFSAQEVTYTGIAKLSKGLWELSSPLLPVSNGSHLP